MNKIINNLIIYTLIICLSKSNASNRWPNHDISTLKLLQIVHRHGERSPVDFTDLPNDPYKDPKYWPDGIGELTTKGKYRMYKLGEFIRNEYNDYLGIEYSPREVFTRSAITERCLESTSCLLSGAYPPKQLVWEWNNGTDAQLGKIWQPFPIQTFMPKHEDILLEGKDCHVVNIETQKISNRSVIKNFVLKYKDLYENVSKIVGKTIDSIESAGAVHSILKIEIDTNYYWNNTWTEEEEQKIVNQLYYSHQMIYRYSADSPIIKRLKAGALVKELNNNIQKVLNNTNDKKLFVYSTHDTNIAYLMHALDVFNDQLPPFGATLLFELHEKRNSVSKSDYFVRLFYQNETIINTGIPYSIPFTDCQNLVDCPLNQYLNSTQHLLFDDYDKECNNKLT